MDHYSVIASLKFELQRQLNYALHQQQETQEKAKIKKKRETILKGKVDTLTLKLEKQKLLFIIYSPNENQTKKFTFDLN